MRFCSRATINAEQVQFFSLAVIAARAGMRRHDKAPQGSSLRRQARRLFVAVGGDLEDAIDAEAIEALEAT
jgi:hypothetical protein